ncbi:MAG: hypothetical protein HKN76_16710, partial [Saprospiraceae bacterium]|nr:hypothetical protein [Saprospiraceae bacterium]
MRIKRISLLVIICLSILMTITAQEVDTLLERTFDEITIVSSRLPSGLLQSSRSMYYQDLSSANQSNQGLAL